MASRDPRVEKRPEFTFEVGRHLEEFQPQRVDDERIGAAVPDRDRLVDEIVGLCGLLGDALNPTLEHRGSPRRAAAANSGGVRLEGEMTGSHAGVTDVVAYVPLLARPRRGTR